MNFLGKFLSVSVFSYAYAVTGKQTFHVHARSVRVFFIGSHEYVECWIFDVESIEFGALVTLIHQAVASAQAEAYAQAGDNA